MISTRKAALFMVAACAAAAFGTAALRTYTQADPLMVRLTPTDVLARPYADGSVVWESADDLQYIRWDRVATGEQGQVGYRSRLQFGRSYDYARSYSLLLHADEVVRLIAAARARGDRELDLTDLIEIPDHWEPLP